MAQPLKPYFVQGVPFEAFNLTEGTTKNVTTAADTAENITVTAKSVVMLVADQDCWFNIDGGTAAEPTDDSTAHHFLPAGITRWFWTSDVTTISILSPDVVAHVEATYWPVNAT